MIAQSAPRPAIRVAIALIAMAVGAGFGLDTWARGWTMLGLVGTAGAALAAVCALLGRVTRRSAFERAAPSLAVAGLVLAVIGALMHRAA